MRMERIFFSVIILFKKMFFGFKIHTKRYFLAKKKIFVHFYLRTIYLTKSNGVICRSPSAKKMAHALLSNITPN